MLKIACFAVVLIAALAAWAQFPKIEKVIGKVEKAGGAGVWRPVSAGDKLKENETLATRDKAWASVRIGPGVSADMQETSVLTLIRAIAPVRCISVKEGAILFSVLPKPGFSLEVLTPYFTGACDAGTFRLYLEHKQVMVSVQRGKLVILDVETRQPRMEVLSGETAMFGLEEKEDKPLMAEDVSRP